MSKKPSALPLFADAYLADTTHLTTEEHGAYLLLLMAAWRQNDCSLPNDDKKLSRIAGLSAKKWSSIKSTIMEFWQVSGDRIAQNRLQKEHEWVAQKADHNRKSAEARWGKQTTENKQNGGMRSHSEGNAPPPPPIEEEPNGSPSSPPPPKSKSAIARKLPDDWQPNLTLNAQRIVDGWPPGMFVKQLAAFRDHAADKGRTSKDWQAAFRTWITNARPPRNEYGFRPNHADRNEPTNAFVRAAAERQAERAAGIERESGDWTEHGQRVAGMD